MFEIIKCEACGNKNLQDVLNLGMHPLCDDLKKIGSNEVCIEYPIEILYCNNCYTAHQKYQVNKNILFPKNYHYRASSTQSVVNFMSTLSDRIETLYGDLNNKIVLDVGCNDGSLLKFFKNKGAITIGVDPTDAINDAYKYCDLAINGFFDEQIANKIRGIYSKIDFILFTNVFAHIENLHKLICSLKIVSSENTKIIIENHYLGSILKFEQFDTFYHEHPRTYSYRSFEFIASKLGMNILDLEFPERYGGNIRVTLGTGTPFNFQIPNEDDFYDKFDIMKKNIIIWKDKTLNMIFFLNKKFGPIPAKAFPGRAAILIKILNLTDKEIEAVYEIKGSIKVGHYVPGTKIPILPEKNLFEMDLSRPILNLAWHLPIEVRSNLSINNYLGEVIDIK